METSDATPKSRVRAERITPMRFNCGMLFSLRIWRYFLFLDRGCNPRAAPDRRPPGVEAGIGGRTCELWAWKRGVGLHRQLQLDVGPAGKRFNQTVVALLEAANLGAEVSDLVTHVG